MSTTDEREWFEGRSKISFADAAKKAVAEAESILEQPWPELYDVRLQVAAEGVLSDYRVFVSPTP
jgi:flavin-binding protein dodecin